MAFHAILSFSLIPLRIASLLGMLTLLLGLVYAVFILYAWCTGGRLERGWTGMMMTVLVLGGVQLLCLGIIAEYLGRVYEEVKRRPLYVVRERIGLASSRAGTPAAAASRPDRRGSFEEPGGAGAASSAKTDTP
jgi:polyisoprenyl-phosphate glycosyltransferase